ncbi:MAG: hypothetical protein NZ601_01650 [candidate division WOR-3 bacterium]|nr:hypothetical protein [candidate division WOR-3 bacterium]MCX7757024.1 hypothetical protein [candidate division WOR-3 bacterium]MDW7987328.1 hypothetical protein [candidate division WOR-3 bacterium]
MMTFEKNKTGIWEKLTKLDRRIIYLLLFLVVLIPLIYPFRLTPRAMSPVLKLFNHIDTIPPDKCLIISVDYTPDTEPELHPMTIALLRHAFSRKIKVGILCISLLGLGLAQDAITTVTNEFNRHALTRDDSVVYGRDYVFWGWQTPVLVPILGMGENIAKVFPVDYYGNKTDTLEFMKTIKNYNDVGILVSISGSAIPFYYITYAQTQFGVRIGVGSTAVQAADFYPYINSGQVTGMMSGMKGAAEYEQLVEERCRFYGRRKATDAMASQTAAHIWIMVTIIIGNISYFILKRRQK